MSELGKIIHAGHHSELNHCLYLKYNINIMFASY